MEPWLHADAPFNDQQTLLPTFYRRLDGRAALGALMSGAGKPEQKLLKAKRAIATRGVDAKKGAL